MFSGIIVISVIAAFKRGVKIRRCVGTDRHGGFARRRRRHPSCGGLRPAPNELPVVYTPALRARPGYRRPVGHLGMAALGLLPISVQPGSDVQAMAL